jgi:pSer/pThr/pTyr-binding forkhead associated (FHA) protein
VTVPRPTLGTVLVSTGERIPLDRPVIVGRRPRAPRFSNDDMPRLVVVDGPQQDISRSHLKIDLVDWSVLVSDLGSTNGTTLRRAGQPDTRLQSGEPTLAQAGDVYDLGDGVTVTVVEIA